MGVPVQSLAICVPIDERHIPALEEGADDMSGDLRRLYDRIRKEQGFSRISSWLQETDSGYCSVVLVEAEDLEKAFGNLAASSYELDENIRRTSRAIMGFPFEEIPSRPVKKLFDWRRSDTVDLQRDPSPSDRQP